MYEENRRGRSHALKRRLRAAAPALAHVHLADQLEDARPGAPRGAAPAGGAAVSVSAPLSQCLTGEPIDWIEMRCEGGVFGGSVAIETQGETKLHVSMLGKFCVGVVVP